MTSSTKRGQQTHPETTHKDTAGSVRLSSNHSASQSPRARSPGAQDLLQRVPSHRVCPASMDTGGLVNGSGATCCWKVLLASPGTTCFVLQAENSHDSSLCMGISITQAQPKGVRLDLATSPAQLVGTPCSPGTRAWNSSSQNRALHPRRN